MHGSCFAQFMGFRALSATSEFQDRTILLQFVPAEHETNVLTSSTALTLQSLLNRAMDTAAKAAVDHGGHFSVAADLRFSRPSDGLGMSHCFTFAGAKARVPRA